MLSKKDKQKYSKKLKEKLEASGIKDEVVMRTVRVDPVPNPAYAKGNGQPKYHMRPVTIAANLQRSMIKDLLRTDKKTIDAFLKQDMGGKDEAGGQHGHDGVPAEVPAAPAGDVVPGPGE